jgi:sporulation protein YlmC with PRC-barrel domain
MLRSMNELYGYTIRATDDTIGSVHDFLFDDRESKVRYLVVDTGNWLPGRKVLIAPEALSKPDWASMTLPVNLTKDQVKNSPDVSTEKPISRQQEDDLRRYYDWPLYWGGWMAPAGTAGNMPTSAEIEHIPQPIERSGTTAVYEETPADTHLRSAKDVTGYHIQATDGEIGHVDDFVLDDEHWTIRYLVIDTRNWLPGRKVVLAPDWVDAVDWNESKVHVSLTKEGVKNSPEFDPEAPVNRQYEETLYDYYGRPKYWN